MTTFAEAVQAAIPEADDELVDFVMWSRTAYPAITPTAREVYRAANRLRRATAAGRRLCDWCVRLADPPDYCCPSCAKALGLP